MELGEILGAEAVLEEFALVSPRCCRRTSLDRYSRIGTIITETLRYLLHRCFFVRLFVCCFNSVDGVDSVVVGGVEPTALIVSTDFCG